MSIGTVYYMCVCIHMYVYAVKNTYIYIIYMYISWQAGIIPQTLGDPFSPCWSKKFIQPLFFLTQKHVRDCAHGLFRLCWPGYSREGAWGQRPSGHHPLIKIVVLPAISAFLGPMQILFSQLLGGFRINPVAKEWDHVPHHLMGLDQHRTRCDSKVMVIGSDEFTNLTLGNLMTVCLCIQLWVTWSFVHLESHHHISNFRDHYSRWACLPWVSGMPLIPRRG